MTLKERVARRTAATRRLRAAAHTDPDFAFRYLLYYLRGRDWVQHTKLYRASSIKRKVPLERAVDRGVREGVIESRVGHPERGGRATYYRLADGTPDPVRPWSMEARVLADPTVVDRVLARIPSGWHRTDMKVLIDTRRVTKIALEAAVRAGRAERRTRNVNGRTVAEYRAVPVRETDYQP